MKSIRITLLSSLFALIGLISCHTKLVKTEHHVGGNQSPRIINIINFIRQTDYRVKNSDVLMFNAVEEQLKLINKYNLPSTFLLQYDALINPEYQQLLKQQLNKQSEVGGWFEITQPQVEAAGLKWKGEHSWQTKANIGFSTGYTLQDREKLVDVYMDKFKEVFGHYPESMGSWYIDAYTLNYMYEKYGLIASCNCRDQIGTDGYTLWGGYWNQAYYPSKKNAYMPAQSIEGQISVPVFRMLGSDPIYQYDDNLGDNIQGVITLEAACKRGGMVRDWVDYFFHSITDQPCLAFNYTQAGQENSFTWEKMKYALEMQIPLIDSLRKINKLQVQTLGESGKWFKKNYSVTPSTAVTTMQDIRNLNNKTVWFNSRYYRANLIWEDKDFRFRDIHLFNEDFKSNYVDKAGDDSKFSFHTLPVVDGYYWSTFDDRAGLQLVQHLVSGETKVIQLNSPVVTEPDMQTLVVCCEDMDKHRFRMSFTENKFEVTCVTKDKDFRWCINLHVAADSELPFQEVKGRQLKAEFNDFDYAVFFPKGIPQLFPDRTFNVKPEGGSIVFDCSN